MRGRLSVLLLMALPIPSSTDVAAQRLPERSPNLPNAVTTMPGALELSAPTRFRDAAGGLNMIQTLDLSLGVPLVPALGWTAGVRFAAGSPTSVATGDEWEVYERAALLRQHDGAPVDLLVTGAWNGAARSLDGEALLARRLGPLRLMAGGRAMSAAYGEDTRFGVVAGAAWHPLLHRSPITVAGDIATLTDRRGGERVAWSGGITIGIPHTHLLLGLQASNAATTTIQGASRGGGTRWGFELNTPITFTGALFGWYATRQESARAVAGDVDAPAAVQVRIAGYLYAPMTVRVRVGDVVEWVNEDAMVHTVTAELGGFDSGAIRTGATWRARFDEPGRYPYYCGPHPFMKGIVIVTR